MENSVIRIHKSQSISHSENEAENCNATKESSDSERDRTDTKLS